MRSVPLIPLTESGILAALRDCYHPELRANIVDLGLVQSIDIAPDSEAPGAGIPGVAPRCRIEIGLLRASPEGGADDIAPQIAALIQNRLAAFPSISRTEVQILREPAWTSHRIAPKLRERIELAIASNHRPHDLVQIQTASAAPRRNS
jgi:metal-sulfur cluster biosynthetic enzyme